jgi:3-oxoacyl-[acyl-carrier protein] reductase
MLPRHKRRWANDRAAPGKGANVSDFLVELGRNPQARKVISSLGLPVKLPPVLKRAQGPDVERHLDGLRVICAGLDDAPLLANCRVVAEAAGADVSVGDRPHALVFDASGLASTSQLRELYDFLHPRVRGLAHCGRVVIIGRPAADSVDLEAAAAAHALRGLVRSLGKELGGKGTTANLLEVPGAAAERIGGPLRFLLGRRSAFVSGQVVSMSSLASAASTVSFSASLAAKVAVVTGAARGIGAQIAARMAQEGANVVIVDLPSAEAEISEIASKVGGVGFACDLGAPDAPERIADYVAREYGGVDIMIHNAGVTRDRTLGKMSEKWWDLCLDINLSAPLRVNDALLKRDLLRDGGRVVHLASIAGIGGNPGQTNYAAAKSGLIGYVASLAPKVAARGITANAVAPGFIETRMTAAIPVVTREFARRLNSLGQGGDPQDVADVVTFLASPGADGLTGTTIRVCGQHLAGA